MHFLVFYEELNLCYSYTYTARFIIQQFFTSNAKRIYMYRVKTKEMLYAKSDTAFVITTEADPGSRAV
jgi:hypothetical protein